MQVLESIEEFNFIEDGQIIVHLPNFLIATKLCGSKRDVKRLIEQNAKITLFTKPGTSTFERMQLKKINGNFALFPGEQIMIGNNVLKMATVEFIHDTSTRKEVA